MLFNKLYRLKIRAIPGRSIGNDHLLDFFFTVVRSDCAASQGASPEREMESECTEEKREGRSHDRNGFVGRIKIVGAVRTPRASAPKKDCFFGRENKKYITRNSGNERDHHEQADQTRI